MTTSEELRDRLKGPVIAMTTHFKDDYSLDLDAMRRLTEYYVEKYPRKPYDRPVIIQHDGAIGLE